jgi:hypothetical protein
MDVPDLHVPTGIVRINDEQIDLWGWRACSDLSTIILEATIVAGNSAKNGPDCRGTATRAANNVLGDGASVRKTDRVRRRGGDRRPRRGSSGLT